MTVEGEYSPEINHEFEIMNLKIQNNIAPITVGLPQRSLKISQIECSGKVLIPVQRMNLIAPGDCCAEIFIAREERTEMIPELYQAKFVGDKNQTFVEIPIDQFPQPTGESHLKIRLQNCHGPIYTIVEPEQAEMDLIVVNDIKKSLYAFEVQTSTINRSDNNFAEVLINRSDRFLEPETLEISINRRAKEKIDFGEGQKLGKLIMKIEHTPVEEEESIVTLELTKVDGPYMPQINSEQSKHLLKIKNNIQFPTISFKKDNSQIFQTNKNHKIDIKFSGWIEHPITIGWVGKVVDKNTKETILMDFYQDLKGFVMFGAESDEDERSPQNTNKGAIYFEQEAAIVCNPYPLPIPDKETCIEFSFKILEPAFSFRDLEIPVKLGTCPKHTLMITNNIPRPVIEFSMKMIQAQQTQKQVVVNVKRFDNSENEGLRDAILASELQLEYELRKTNAATGSIQNLVEGEVTLKRYCSETFIAFDLDDEPLLEPKSCYQIVLKDIKGKEEAENYYPVFGADICNIEVDNDVPRPLFGFNEKSVVALQSCGTFKLPIEKYYNFSKGTHDEHKIFYTMVDENGKNIRESHCTLTEFENTCFVEIEMPTQPLSESVVYQIEITKVEGPYFPKLGGINKQLNKEIFAKCDVNIENNLRPGSISFEDSYSCGFDQKDPIILNQSVGQLKLRLIREGYVKNSLTCSWYSDLIEGNPHFDDLIGVETFKPNDCTSSIAVTLPNLPIASHQFSLFTIKLDEPLGEFQPKLGDRCSMYIKVIHDVSVPKIQFKNSRQICAQSDVIADVPLERIGQTVLPLEVFIRGKSCKNNGDDLSFDDERLTREDLYEGKYKTKFNLEDKNQVISVDLPQFPRHGQSDYINLNISALKPNKGVEIGNNSNCILEVKNDFPKPKINLLVDIKKNPMAKIKRSQKNMFFDVELQDYIFSVSNSQKDSEFVLNYEVTCEDGEDTTLQCEDEGQLIFTSNCQQKINLDFLQIPYPDNQFTRIKLSLFVDDLLTSENIRILGIPPPSINIPEYLIEIENNVAHNQFGFQTEKSTCKLSEIDDIIVPVMRKVGKAGSASIEWETFLSDERISGMLEFDVNTQCQEIKIPKNLAEDHFIKMINNQSKNIDISSEMLQNIEIRLTQIRGEHEPIIFAGKNKLIIQVQHDETLIPTLSWADEDVEIRQSAEKLMAPVIRRFGDPELEIQATWTVHEESGKNSDYRGNNGIVKIAENMEAAHAQINLSTRPQDNKMDKFELKLSDLKSKNSKYEPRLGAFGSMMVTVLNDLERSVVTWEKERYRFSLAKHENIECVILRSASNKHIVEAQWMLEPEDPEMMMTEEWKNSEYYGFGGVIFLLKKFSWAKFFLSQRTL